MIIEGISELTIFDVLRRGQPNEERVAIRVEEPVGMGQFGILIGKLNEDRTVTPYLDNMFWFGNGDVQRDDWLFIYTGAGDAKARKSIDGKSNVYTLYWAKKTTSFAQSDMVPVLFRMGGIEIAYPEGDVPQLESPTGT